jgi:hypothetical protein
MAAKIDAVNNNFFMVLSPFWGNFVEHPHYSTWRYFCQGKNGVGGSAANAVYESGLARLLTTPFK